MIREEYKPEEYFSNITTEEHSDVSVGTPIRALEKNLRTEEQIDLTESVKDSGWNKLEQLITSRELVVPQNKRCPLCYKLRLEKTAKKAKELNFDYFSTTLLIYPYQNRLKIKKIGNNLKKVYNVMSYFKDFFKDFTSYFYESKIISRKRNIYPQKYCGCIFSKLRL